MSSTGKLLGRYGPADAPRHVLGSQEMWKYCRSYKDVEGQGNQQPIQQSVYRFADGGELGEITLRGSS